MDDLTIDKEMLQKLAGAYKPLNLLSLVSFLIRKTRWKGFRDKILSLVREFFSGVTQSYIS